MNYDSIFDSRQVAPIGAIVLTVVGLFIAAVLPPLGVLLLVLAVFRARAHRTKRGRLLQAERARLERRREAARTRAWLSL